MRERRGDALSPNLRDCGVLGIVSHCEEFSTTYPRLQLKFRAQTGSVGCVAREKNVTGLNHWLLRKRQRMRDRKRVGSRQRSLSFLSFLPRRERPLLAGNPLLPANLYLSRRLSL